MQGGRTDLDDGEPELALPPTRRRRLDERQRSAGKRRWRKMHLSVSATSSPIDGAGDDEGDGDVDSRVGGSVL
jgi:hypothetical protein